MMPQIIYRKCNACKKPIEIDTLNVHDVAFYKKLYYHSACLQDIAESRSKKNSAYAKEWAHVLEHIQDYESETADQIQYRIYQDDLNEWILNNYDVTSVHSRFWNCVADLHNGSYRGKKCKPVRIKTLVNLWKWGQHNLDKINQKNKINHTGPSNDGERLQYDLSILINQIPNYNKSLAKISAMEVERMARQQETTQVDYSRIKSNSNNSGGLDDISDLLEDLI